MSEVILPGRNTIGVSVSAIIVWNGKALVSLRGPDCPIHQDQWEFPGGKVDFFETTQDAVTREVKEEVGLQIEWPELLAVQERIEEWEHWIQFTYLCTQFGGRPEIKEPGKCRELRWCTLPELQELTLTPFAQLSLKALISSGNQGYLDPEDPHYETLKSL